MSFPFKEGDIVHYLASPHEWRYKILKVHEISIGNLLICDGLVLSTAPSFEKYIGKIIYKIAFALDRWKVVGEQERRGHPLTKIFC